MIPFNQREILICLFIIFIYLNCYCRLSGWLYSPISMRNISKKLKLVLKKLKNFEGSAFLNLYIDLLKFSSKSRQKILDSDPCFFYLVKLGTISPAAQILN